MRGPPLTSIQAALPPPALCHVSPQDVGPPDLHVFPETIIAAIMSDLPMKILRKKIQKRSDKTKERKLLSQKTKVTTKDEEDVGTYHVTASARRGYRC